MLKLAKRTVVILSMAMVAGVPVAAADTKAPPNAAKSTTATTTLAIQIARVELR